MDLLSWISENLSPEHSAPKISLNTSINDVGDTLEAFIANRLIPLKKNPGIRPIGVGEVIRGIAGKLIMNIARKDAQ